MLCNLQKIIYDYKYWDRERERRLYYTHKLKHIVQVVIEKNENLSNLVHWTSLQFIVFSVTPPHKSKNWKIVYEKW